jgi:exopolysaccharide production protein ExoQ
MTQVATLLVIFGIIGLFVLDYDPRDRTSGWLWLAVVWLGVAGSRPISAWFDMRLGVEQFTEGSPVDRNFFMALLAIGLAVLATRANAVVRILRANAPIVIFLLYCALSIGWSDYPDVAFKRWIKSLGDFVMILIILTERDQILALKKVLSRIAFVAVPLSVLFIKYYPALGREYSYYEGTAYYVGVAADKNMLGKICLVLGLGLMWRLLEEWRGARRRRIVLAVGTTFGMTLWLFAMANSMTSLSCFVFGNCIIIGTSVLKAARKRSFIHLMAGSLIVISFAVLFLNVGDFVLQMLGRNPNLTGRTDLWQELIKMPTDPILGTGFESFWLGKRLAYIWSLHWWHPNEAHDGYLELFLNLGWVGVALFAGVIVSGYKNILKLMARVPSAGRIRLAFFVVGIAYNYTESAIRTLDPMWFIFMFSVFAVPSAIPARYSPEQENWAEPIAKKSFEWKWDAVHQYKQT